MSFILDALKKSENKRRKKAQQLPRSIHEPVAYKIPRPRSWVVWVLVVLVLNVVVLGWLATSWWRSSDSAAQTQNHPTYVANGSSKIVKPEVPPQAVETPVTPFPPVERKRAALSVQTKPAKPPVSAPLPVPRTDKRVYDYQQLPVSIRQQIPALKMALHAYDRQNPNSSMVQLNGQIYRAQDSVEDLLLLEEITEKGVVLRYDGYRFLLPRRH